MRETIVSDIENRKEQTVKQSELKKYKGYKVFRIEEPAAWGFTVHFLASESFESLREEIEKDILELLDEEIPSVRTFWKRAYVYFLGESDTKNIDPTYWSYQDAIAQVEVEI